MRVTRRQVLGGLAATAFPRVSVGRSSVLVNPEDFGAQSPGDALTNETAFNAATAAVRSTGGVIEINPRPYFMRSWDLTALNSVIVRGKGGGVNGPQGAKILPTPGHIYPTVDMTGSAIVPEHFQVGDDALEPSKCALWFGQIDGFNQGQLGNQASTLINAKRLYVTGKYTAFSMNLYGTHNNVFDDCFFYNKIGSGGVVAITRSNIFGMQSRYKTISTIEHGAGGTTFKKCEFHDFVPGQATPSGTCLLLSGAWGVTIKEKSALDSSNTSQGTIICMNSPAGHDCGLLALEDFNIHSENAALGMKPAYGVQVMPGSSLNGLIVRHPKSVNAAIAPTVGNITWGAGDAYPL